MAQTATRPASLPELSQAILAVEKNLVRYAPYAQWERVDVTFGAANKDYDIPHTLKVADPEDVDYSVLRADRATSIFHDQSATRTPWQPKYILLRSSAASAVVTLLLSIRQPR